ncbi:MAG TPA: hypothetical protein VLE19_05540 [Pyrinomonadaceae bacterium]|nr:hypothetical protein [Pyrinomonadaceae bacterium]
MFHPPRTTSLLVLVFLTNVASASAQTATFSGRVTDQNTGLGIPEVAVVAVGNQTGARVAVTNGLGDYAIEMGTNTNIQVRAYRTKFVFNPLFTSFSSIGGPVTGLHPLNFEGTAWPISILIFPLAPVLLTEDNSLQALALDSLLLTRDPFSLINSNYFGSDKQTRIKLLVVDLDLFSGETLSIISVQAVDNQQIPYDLAVEDLRKVPATPWMSQLTVRLPNNISIPNELRVTVTARGFASNAALIRAQ